MLADAEEDVAAGRAALAKVTAMIAEHEDELARAGRRVEDAIGAILAGEVDRLISETEALRDALEGKRAVLRFVSHLSPAGSGAGYRASRLLPTPPPGEAPPGSANHPALAPWRAALEALRRSADAPLPEAK